MLRIVVENPSIIEGYRGKEIPAFTVCFVFWAGAVRRKVPVTDLPAGVKTGDVLSLVPQIAAPAHDADDPLGRTTLVIPDAEGRNTYHVNVYERPNGERISHEVAYGEQPIAWRLDGDRWVQTAEVLAEVPSDAGLLPDWGVPQGLNAELVRIYREPSPTK